MNAAETDRNFRPGVHASAILFAALLVFTASGGAAEVQLENSPLAGDTAQQRWVRDHADLARETNRFRLVLPASAVQVVPAQNHTDAKHSPLSQPGVTTVSSNRESFGLGMITALLAAFLATLIYRKLKSDYDGAGLPDEKAFSEFLAGFRAGPKGVLETHKSQIAEQNGIPEPPIQKQLDVLKTEAQRLFFASTPEQLLAMWNLLQLIQSQSSASERQNMLSQLCEHMQSLKYAASFPEVLPVWQLASVAEGLIKQLAQRTGEINATRLDWVASAINLLTELCRPDVLAELITAPPIRLMAVDDDLVSRRAMAHALGKAFRQPDLATNGEAALAQISTIPYDVIFLDILMPGLDGFELHEKIRQTTVNRSTPVVFVTSEGDTPTREKVELCHGALIIKPFLTFEITLTAMVLATRARFRKLHPALDGQTLSKQPDSIECEPVRPVDSPLAMV